MSQYGHSSNKRLGRRERQKAREALGSRPNVLSVVQANLGNPIKPGSSELSSASSVASLSAKAPRFNDPIGNLAKSRVVDRPHFGCRGYKLEFTPLEVIKVACDCQQCLSGAKPVRRTKRWGDN